MTTPIIPANISTPTSILERLKATLLYRKDQALYSDDYRKSVHRDIMQIDERLSELRTKGDTNA